MFHRFMTPALAAVALAGVSLIAAPASAQQMPWPGDTATLTVTGEGEAAVPPDMAVVTLTVLREGDTARAALDASSEAMDDVLETMREEGIADRDLQTAGFSINPRYTQPREGEPMEAPEIAGYEVANTLTVRLRDLERLGAILDLAVSLGVNRGGDIMLTNDDPSATLAEARTDAVEDAAARAETLAAAAGVSLGRVMRIDEKAQHFQPIPMARAEMARGFAADASVPIAEGENTYRVNVTMTWELEQAEEAGDAN